MELAGRVALVTGAGRRVGRAIAVALGGRGMRIAVHFNASAAEAEKTAALIDQAGGAARLLRSNLAAADAPAALVHQVLEQFGSLAVVVTIVRVMSAAIRRVGRSSGLHSRSTCLPPFRASGGGPRSRRARAIVTNRRTCRRRDLAGVHPHTIRRLGLVRTGRSLPALAPTY